MPGAHGLIISGTPFTITITFQNLSYVHKIAVEPFSAELSGNAFGGQVVLAGGAIEPPSPTRMPVPPEFLMLDPRQTLDAEVVVYTTESQGALQNVGKQGVGGTRASVTIPTLGASYVTDQGKQGEPVAGKDIALNGETHFEVGIDDRDLFEPQKPFTWGAGWVYFSAGLVQGVGNFFSGMVHAIPELPLLVGKGLVAIPSALYSYARFEAELWHSIQNDPAAQTAFGNQLTAQAYLMYKHAEGFASSDFKKQIDAAATAYFTDLTREWYSGNWGAAVQQVGAVTGEAVAPVASEKLAVWLVRGLGPGILIRSAPVLEAFAKQKGAAFTAFGEELTAKFPKFARALDAVSALSDAKAVGYAFSDTQIRQLYGLSGREAAWLRNYAKTKDLLIVVRSRAVESLAWLDRQIAVLKPEWMKLKNVSLYDSEYLGYPESDIGRVVISQHELPTVAQVEAKMTANGLSAADADWKAILKRLTQRQSEFTDPLGSGTVKDMISAAKKGPSADHGEVTMNWNLADNQVDPTSLTVTPTTYEFRLAKPSGKAIPKGSLDTYKGTMIPEFKVNGQWKCVTGDVDFLHSDAERAVVYADMAREFGFLHPESATWTLNGLFTFPKKTDEFVRAGLALQFAPDGVARGVKFLTATFKDKLDYVIEWAGGATNPTGALAP